MNKKLYHIEFKETGFNFYYGDLTILCNTWKNISVSKFTLDRYDFIEPFENETCIIRKSFYVTSTRSVK
jgi:hypothetical protein